MSKISEILAKKIMVKRVGKISMNATIMEAVQDIFILNVGAIVVTDDDQKIVGMFTERDILRKVIPKNIDIQSTQVADVMTRNPATVGPEASVAKVFKYMNALNVRHVPVIDNDKIVGIISIKDIAKVCMKLLQEE